MLRSPLLLFSSFVSFFVSMKNIFRQSSAVLLLYYIGRLISFLSKVYLLPFVLSPGLLGLYSGFEAISFVLCRFDVGPSIIQYSVRLQDNKQKKASFFGGVVFITTVLYLLIVLPFFLWKKPLINFFSSNASEILSYLPISTLLGYIMVLNITIKSWYISLKRIIYPNFLQHIVLPFFKNLNILCFYWEIFSFHQMLIGLIISYTINLCLLMGYLSSIGELRLHWDIRILGKRFIRSFLLYSLFIIVSVNLILMLTRIDTIMILGMCSKKEAGIYSTVAFIALLLNAPIKALNQATFTTIATMLAKKTYDKLDILYKKVTLYQCFFSCLLFSLLYACLPYLFYALPTDVLNMGKSIFILLAVGELIYSLFNVSHTILIFSKHYKLHTFTFLLLLLGVGANYLMISAWGLMGAAGATFLTLIIAGLCTCCLVWHKLNMHPFSAKLGIVIGMTILNLILQTCLPTTSQILINTGLRILVVLITYSLLALYQNKIHTLNMQ